MKLHSLNMLMPLCLVGLVALGFFALENEGLIQVQSVWIDILIDGTNGEAKDMT